MTPRPRLRAALLAACAVAVAWAPSGADAADATAAGWWHRLQSGQLAAVPPPPGVEDGDLFVQGAPDDAAAIAAVRFDVGPDETAPVLQLRFAQEGAGEAAAAAVVLACPATTPWNPGGNQAWTSKPVPDCSRQAIGAVSEDGASMVFDISSFAVGDVVDLVILPGRVEGLPEGTAGSVFTLVFDAPTDADLVTQPAGAPISAPPATSAAGSSATPASSGAQPSTGGSGSTAVATGARPTPSFQPPAAPAAPALPASEVAAPAGAATTGSVAPFDAASTTDRGDAKTLAVILLVAAAVATLLANRRGPLLELLGATPAAATPAIAGLGRFAKEREGAPPTLR